jgi:hypothetical protein
MDVDLKDESAILALAKELVLVDFELKDYLTTEETGMLVPNSGVPMVGMSSMRQLYLDEENEENI